MFCFQWNQIVVGRCSWRGWRLDTSWASFGKASCWCINWEGACQIILFLNLQRTKLNVWFSSLMLYFSPQFLDFYIVLECLIINADAAYLSIISWFRYGACLFFFSIQGSSPKFSYKIISGRVHFHATLLCIALNTMWIWYQVFYFWANH